MSLARRSVGLGLLLSATIVLSGCGFHLRGPQNYAFRTIAVRTDGAGGVGAELTRVLGDRVRPATAAGDDQPQITLDILREQRDKSAVGVNASGQVREFQLGITLRFRVRNNAGKELIPPTDIAQQRDISFSETAVLAKDAEEAMLYRDMQSDIVQQLLRRLGALQSVE
jgi:LPS-assembly lipoprotein